MFNLDDVVNNIKTIYLTDSALDTLMDFERVVDDLNMYAFANWMKGELIEGPIYEKYFITCKFMWPYKMMPDPSAGQRLLDYGCEVFYEMSRLQFPIKVTDEEDFREQGSIHKPKLQTTPIWIVTIVMPRELIKDIRQGSVDIEGEEIDLEDLETAYDEGLDDQENLDTTDLDDAPPATDEEETGAAPEETGI